MRKKYIDEAFQKKTNALVQEHIGVDRLQHVSDFVKIDADTVELIKKQKGGDGKKVINLIKSIQKTAEEDSGDPFLIAMAVLELFEGRQTSTADALAELLKEIEKDEQRKKEQVARGLDGLTYFVLCKLTDDGIPNPDSASKKVAAAFSKVPNWQRSEAELREVRQLVTFAVYSEEDDMGKVTTTVESLFTLLHKSFRP
jgi:type I restriction enzyme R subunit